MTREARLRGIREFVMRNGSVQVRSLSEQLRVSEETVRRDLDQLASLGLIRRVRGGAAAPGTSLTEFPYHVRQQSNRREKRAIARAAVDAIVSRGTSVGLDSGSTTLEIARALRGTNVTVVTNSLPVISELVGSDCTVVVVGGVARARSLSLIGPLAQRAGSEFHCDVAFISAPAITPLNGPMDTDLEEIEFKRALLRHAVRRYAAVDHTKFGRTAFSKICEATELTGIVTDDGTDEDMLARFRELGVEVIVGRRGEEGPELDER